MATIVYRDTSPGASADASYSATGQDSQSTLSLGTQNPPVRYASLEVNRWLLDGTFGFRDSNTVHLWSAVLSDDDMDFSTKPTLTINFDDLHTSFGVSFVFDRGTGEFCRQLNIKWYRNSTLLDDEEFYPNAPQYFCENQVENFNKIVITFKRTSLPYRRLRLDQVVFGITRVFENDEIAGANAVNETDLLGASLPASQLDWTLRSKNDIDYMFQLKQPMELRDGDNLIGVYYVSKSRRISQNVYQITAQDAIGVLGEQQYDGGAFLSGISAKTLAAAVVGDSFQIDFSSVQDATLYGLLLKQSRREALQQVIFAWQKAIRSDGDNKLIVFAPSTTPTPIQASRTYLGVSVETAPIVTEVNVVEHTYSLDPNGSIEVGGQKYIDAQTVYTVSNPLVTSADIANIIEVTDATLVSTHNGQSVAQRVYDYYTRRNTHRSRIVLNVEKLGDCVSQPTPWNTQEVGNIRSISITMSGIVAADVESVGVEQ